MKANMILGVALAGLLALASTAVEAEVLILTPTQSAVCPADESGVTKVVLQFDLSGITGGEGRQIDQALLEWVVTGMPSPSTTPSAARPSVSIARWMTRPGSGWREATPIRI